MCDIDHFAESVKEYEARGLVTRRQFGKLVAAGIALMLPEVANAQAVTERDVEIKTTDGTCDAYFVYPGAPAAAVLIWPDIFGLRPAMRTMGRRLAQSGYSVLVVNPFYRGAKAPLGDGSSPIAQMQPYAKALSETTHMTDARAFIGWLDAQPQVNKNRRIGTQGYCMGGPMAFRTAAAVPGRVGAVASFHGGGLVNVDAARSQPPSAGGRHEGILPCCHR